MRREFKRVSRAKSVRVVGKNFLATDETRKEHGLRNGAREHVRHVGAEHWGISNFKSQMADGKFPIENFCG
jgi:hypothetical protein